MDLMDLKAGIWFVLGVGSIVNHLDGVLAFRP